MGMKKKFPNTFYFYLTLRFLAGLCCIIVLFCIGLSQYWTTRTSAVFALLFVIFALLFIGSAISILFVWDITNTTLVKRCLFVFIFTLSILISAVMLLLANDGCDSKMVSQYGCYQNMSTGTFQVAAAFCFLIMVFGMIDLAINIFFYYKDNSGNNNNEKKKNHIYDLPPPPPTVSTIKTEKNIHDLYMELQRTGQTTAV